MNRHKITSLPRTSNGKSRIDTPKAYNFESLTSKRNNYGLYKISKAESPPSQSKKKRKKRKKERERSHIFWVSRASQLPHPFPPHISLHLISRLWLAHSFPFFSLFFFIFSHTLLSTLISSLTGTSTPPPPLFPPSFSNKITRKLLRTYKHLHILFLR